VHTSDDVDIGDIDAINRSFIAVKRGFVNIHYYYIPYTKVEGWDGHVVWLKVTEDEVKAKFERDMLPDPARYYVKNYPGYTSAYYPPIILAPVKKMLPPVYHKVGRYASAEPRVYKCDLCDTTFTSSDYLSSHVKISH
jgi:hypothetical protein